MYVFFVPKIESNFHASNSLRADMFTTRKYFINRVKEPITKIIHSASKVELFQPIFLLKEFIREISAFLLKN